LKGQFITPMRVIGLTGSGIDAYMDRWVIHSLSEVPQVEQLAMS
jgi:hypothetical protein